jgi:hypothetical protein
MARECAVVRIVCHTLGRHHPRKRMIQYSETPAMESKSRGVLDTPLEPVIGLAKGETRWRGMTTYRGGWRCHRRAMMEQGGEAIRASSFRDGPKDQTRNLEIPGSMLRIAPE